jgi:hypothetical protein
MEMKGNMVFLDVSATTREGAVRVVCNIVHIILVHIRMYSKSPRVVVVNCLQRTMDGAFPVTPGFLASCLLSKRPYSYSLDLETTPSDLVSLFRRRRIASVHDLPLSK